MVCPDQGADGCVLHEGLEPTRPKTPDPKSGASANSANRACCLKLESQLPEPTERSALQDFCEESAHPYAREYTTGLALWQRRDLNP